MSSLLRMILVCCLLIQPVGCADGRGLTRPLLSDPPLPDARSGATVVPAQPKAPLRLGVVNTVAQAPWVMAMHREPDQQLLELVRFSRQASLLRFLIDHRVDLAILPTHQIVRLSAEPGAEQQFKVVYLLHTPLSTEVVVADQRVSQVNQLAGRTVAWSLQDNGPVMAAWLLAMGGVKSTDILPLIGRPDQVRSAFNSGQAAVAVLCVDPLQAAGSSPTTAQGRDALASANILLTAGHLTDLLDGYLVVRAGLLKTDRDRLEALLAMRDRAMVWSKAHPDQAAELLAGQWQLSTAVAGDAIAAVRRHGLKDNQLRWPTIVPRSFHRAVTFMQEWQLIPADAKPKLMLTSTPLGVME